jgi:hypothetical protein
MRGGAPTSLDAQPFDEFLEDAVSRLRKESVASFDTTKFKVHLKEANIELSELVTFLVPHVTTPSETAAVTSAYNASAKYNRGLACISVPCLHFLVPGSVVLCRGTFVLHASVKRCVQKVFVLV